MPIRWDVDPGGEWLIPFAKKKLAQLKAQFADIDIHYLQRWLQVDDGTRIGVIVNLDFDMISIRAGSKYAWVTTSSEGSGPMFFVSRSLGSPTVVGPNEAVTYLNAAGNSVFTGASAFRIDRNAREEVALAVYEDGAGGSTLWFGWLTTHRNGGRFTATSTYGSEAFVKILLSSTGTRVLIRGAAFGSDVVRVQKLDATFTTGEDGAVTTTGVLSTLLDDFLPGGFTFQNEMYFNRAQTIGYVYGHDNSALQVERLFALDVETGAWSTVFDYAETAVEDIIIRPDAQGTVWSVVVGSAVNVYRGDTLVHSVTGLVGALAILADQQHAVSSSGDTFAFAIRYANGSGFAVKFVAIHKTKVVVTDLDYSGSRWFDRAPIVPAAGLLAFYEPADPADVVGDPLKPRVVVFTEAAGVVTSETQIVRSEVATTVNAETNYLIPGASIQWYGSASGAVRHHKVALVTPEGDTPYWERTVVLEKSVAQLGGRFLEPVASTRHWVL